MQWQYTPYVLPLIVSAAVSAALALFAWRRRSMQGAAPLTWLMLAVVEWSLAYALELGGVGLRTKVFWVKVEYLGIVTAPAAWLAFALQYTDRGKWLTRRNAILLAVVPLVTLLQAWTNESHGLMWSDIRLDTSGSLEMLDSTYGGWWWINTAYTYGLLVLGTGLLVQTVLRSPHLYRRQAAALLTGVLAPWVGNVLYIFDLGPFPHLDLTPSAFTLTGLALTWSLFHYRLFDIVPIARGVILESMDDSVMVLDARNRVVDANLAATRVIGRPVLEIIGQPVEQVLSAWPDLIERYRDVTETHAEIALDVGATQRHYDLHISSLFDQRDHLAGRLLVSRDITERKRAEEALKESEEKLRLIFENAFDGISIYEELPGRARRLLDCNERYAEMSGRSREELLEVRNIGLIQRNLGPLRSDEENLRIRRNQESYRGLFSWIRPDGKENIVEYSAAPIHVGGRDLTVGVDRDITERKQAEEMLRETNRRLEEALAELKATQERIVQQERLAAVGQLAAGIAHEFNNIMASVALYTQMSLRTSELSPKTRERLETIAEQAERATDLVRQILDFGRRAMLKREILDMAPLLEEATSLLEGTLPENVEIDLAYAPGKYTVNADPERVQQAIVNLALNARDAMPEGGVLHIGLDRLRIEEDRDAPLSEMKGGEWVRVTVTDTGTGIPSEVLPHIYEPFFTTRAPLGHGLGLAQAYGIVKQHGGHIGVETQMGEGTTFTVYWPALPVTESQLEIPVREMTGLAQGNGETILVVEDNQVMRAALVDCLEMLNYRVLEAGSGREALAMYEEHQDEILLVLSDWVMPPMGGLELARALRQRNPAMKVLVMTGHSLDQEVKDTAPEGVVGWVQKPLQLKQLAEVVARALGMN